MVTVDSLPKLHKTNTMVIGTLHHTVVLDFVVMIVKDMGTKQQCEYSHTRIENPRDSCMQGE
jgi:hypothetical protein